MTTYYKVDGQKLTYAEYWRMAPDPFSFCIAALQKLLGTTVPMSFSIPRVDHWHLVDPEEVPARVTEWWKAPTRDCLAANLELQFCYTIPVLEEDRESYAAIYLSPDGLTAVNVSYVRSPPMQKTAVFCLSQLVDGRC